MKPIFYTIKQLIFLNFKKGEAWKALSMMEKILEKQKYSKRENKKIRLLCFAKLPLALLRYSKEKEDLSFPTYFSWYVSEIIKSN